MTLAHDLSCVGHVVAHGRPFDVRTVLGEWPDGGLDLLQGVRPLVVHGEIGDDGPYGITRGAVGRGEREWPEDVNAQCRSVRWARRVGTRRGWNVSGARNIDHADWRRRRWGSWTLSFSDHENGLHLTSASPTRTRSSEVETADQEHAEQRGGEVEHAGEHGAVARLGCLAMAMGRRGGDREFLRELECDSRWSANIQRRSSNGYITLVLRSKGPTGQDLERPATVPNGDREVVGGVDQAVVVRGERVVGLVDWVDSRRHVATARSRHVAKGRGGKRRHGGEKVAGAESGILKVHGTATETQRQIDLAPWRRIRVSARIIGRQGCVEHPEYRRQVSSGEGIGDGDSKALVDLIERGLLGHAGTSRYRRSDNGHTQKTCESQKDLRWS